MKLAAIATGAMFSTAAAWAATPPVTSESIWKLLVLGIPLAVLAASMGSSALKHIREQGQPDRNIPRLAVWIISDAFIGGWIAMFLIGLPLTREYVASVEPAIVGALCTLLVQFLRDRGPGWADQGVQAVLSWFSRRRAGGEP
jgi:hypothetical protein